MRNFEILFDEGESSPIDDPAYARYGRLGFPPPPHDRPWIYSNFVQSLDGIVSLRGKHAAGADISQSAEDRWLMDLLRAHADAVLLGVNTLIDETILRGRETRGPIFRIMDPAMRELRQKLRRGREKNIFVTRAANLNLSDYRVFDGEKVDAIIVSTRSGAVRLQEKRSHPQVKIVVAGDGDLVDLAEMVRVLRRDFGIQYLLCEGGPTLYGWMSRAGLIDEKFLTVAPIEVGQQVPPEQEKTEFDRLSPTQIRPTIFGAPGFLKDEAPHWRWISARRVDDHEFNRYRRKC